MNIKPLVKDFIAPECKGELSGGLDIYFQEDVELRVGKDNVINLGFSAEVPEGHVALLVPRSGAGIKGLALRNTVGVIDADYYGNEDNDGEIGFTFYNLSNETVVIEKGEKLRTRCISKIFNN